MFVYLNDFINPLLLRRHSLCLASGQSSALLFPLSPTLSGGGLAPLYTTASVSTSSSVYLIRSVAP